MSADEGTVIVSGYISSADSAIEAYIDARTGEITSQYVIPDMPKSSSTSAFSSFALYTPRNSKDVLAITAYGDKIMAFHTTDHYDATSGRHYHPGWLSWNNTDVFNASYLAVADNDINIQSTVAIGRGNVYFGTPSGEVIALDAATGIEQWRVFVGGYIGSSPVLDENIERLYVTGSEGLFILSTSSFLSPSNRLLATFPASTTTSSPALSTDAKTLYFASDTAIKPQLYAIDLEDTFFSSAGNTAIENRRNRRRLLTASVRWQYSLNAPVQLSSPVVDSSGMIYIGDSGGTVYAVNSTGSLMWSHNTGGAVYGSASLSGNHTILIGSQSGLHAFYAKPQTEESATPPVQLKDTDFPNGGLWAIFSLLLCICILLGIWLCIAVKRNRKNEQAKKRMAKEIDVVERRHRGSNSACGLRSVYSSQDTSTTSEVLGPAELERDRQRAEWGSRIGDNFARYTTNKRQRTYTKESGATSSHIEFPTGKWSRTRGSSEGRSTSMYSFGFGIGVGGGGGAGGRHGTFNTDNALKERSPSGGSGSDSGSGNDGIVHGLFAMLRMPDATSNKSNKENKLSNSRESAGQSPYLVSNCDGKGVLEGTRGEATRPSQEVIEIRIFLRRQCRRR